jgi:hypothetical protein
MSTSTSDPRAAYLQHRAVLHETLCRVAATFVCHPHFLAAVHPCRLRKCRRDGVCAGVMCPSARLQERILMMQKVGWSSSSSATLPLCMVAADDEAFELFETYKNDWAQRLADNPEMRWADLVWILRALIEGKVSLVARPPSDAASTP